MKKNLKLAICVLLFISCQHKKSEETQTKGILNLKEYIDEKEQLVGSCIKEKKHFENYNECNYYKAHILIELLSSNKDSIVKAIKYNSFAYKIHIPYNDECRRRNKTVLIFYYDSEEKYSKSQWLLRAQSKEDGLPIVEFNTVEYFN